MVWFFAWYKSKRGQVKKKKQLGFFNYVLKKNIVRHAFNLCCVNTLKSIAIMLLTPNTVLLRLYNIQG